ncbi:ABC transporter ATP-binding protein [Microbaculum marinum]|uniref:ABC transporter ATP-binding protein n=1 Tax=Microbaculum marinum TaxID=1764581 RepID=A0AAW9RSP1_9HYPH
MTILTTENLEVRLGGRPVLEEISIQVPKGGLVTVLGRNGVGKTTLLRCITGFYRPSGGDIRFDGESIARLKSHQVIRRGISHAPEGRQLFADMPVHENLRAGALHLSDAEFAARLGEVIELFPILGERRTQLAGSLSGGEQQMLCIGRALMSSPRLLLLDEPSLGLAPKIIARIFELIMSVRSTGVAVLLVEQNARLALKVADYAYVIDQGRVAVEGTSAELAHDDGIISAYLGTEPDE